MSITELVVKRPSIVVVIFTLLSFLGILSYSKLSSELMPKLTVPVVSVTTMLPGASPTEVERSITKPIEDALANLENLDEITSSSLEGVSSVILSLKPEADVDLALQDAQRKVNAIKATMPDNSTSPIVGKFAFDEMPIMRMGATAQMEPRKLYQLIEEEIVPELAKLEGVGNINIIGGEEREIKVNIDRRKAEINKISILQIRTAIQNSNIEFPTGKIENSTEQAVIKLAGKYQSLEQLENLIIATNPNSGANTYLKEVATVIDGTKDVNTFSRINGKNSIALSIQKQSDANAVDISNAIKKSLADLEKEYDSQGLKFDVSADSSIYILKATHSVIEDLGLAVLIVALVMLLFLHSFRNALIVMIAIPASLVSVFIVMYVFGFTLNMMTLLAISLVVGILVDDSIVVLENIYRHLEKGSPKREAAIEGRSEIGFTALGITLVDVVVFLPITLVGGIIADMLLQFSMVVVVSTLMSLFVSFTLTPLLASRFGKIEVIHKNRIFGRILYWFEHAITSLTNWYVDILKWVLAHKRYVLPSIVILLFSSFGLIVKGYIGTEFISSGDRGEFQISLELPAKASIEQTNEAVKKVEEYFFKDPEIENIFANIGSSSSQMGGSANSLANKAEIIAKMVDVKDRTHTAAISAQYAKLDLEKILPDVKVYAAATSSGGSSAAPIQIIVTGLSIESNIKFANELMRKLNSIKGTTDIKISAETGNPEVSIEINREKMAALGLSMETVGATMQNAFAGNNNSKFTEAGKDYDINIKYDDFNKKNMDDISNFFFINNKGQIIRFDQFASITRTLGATKLERKNRIPSVTVSSQVLGVSSGVVSSQMEEYIAQADIPKGTSVEFGGSIKNMLSAFANMGFALLASLLSVYLIMVLLYDSYVYPFVVLFSIPVAIVGALLALALSFQPLSIFSILGMIMLVGLVAKNAILIVDFTNHLKERGKDTITALLESVHTRMRPILMTTISMIFGMMPIALAKGPGAEFKSGLAWVLIGGLTSSMILTVILVPCIYLIVDILRKEISNKNAKKMLKSIKGV